MKTLIFGAGASIPFFKPVLNTAYLTNKVCDKTEWDRVIDKVRAYKGEEHVIVESSIIMSIIDAIRKFQPTANFEQIAEVIDKISSYGFDRKPTNNMMNLLITVMNTGFKPHISTPFGAEWSDVPFLLREIIAESILDLQTNIKPQILRNL